MCYIIDVSEKFVILIKIKYFHILYRIFNCVHIYIKKKKVENNL